MCYSGQHRGMDNFWHNRKVFITGGNGFLGSHLTSLLIKHGARPVVPVYEENPGGVFDQEDLAAACDIVYGDITNIELMQSIIRSNKIEIIFHLAAQAIVDQALEDPLATFDTNIKGTWNILEVSLKSDTVKKIIVASSDKAYGEHDTLPYIEDVHSLKGTYPYEVSKVCADLISTSYYKSFGLPVAITRCANLYGPGDLKMNRLIPRTIAQLHAGQPPIIRDRGTSLRDYLYVGDAAEAYRLLAEKMDATIFGHAFNFATNVPISVMEAIQIISKEMHSMIQPQTITTHGLEIRHQFASFEKAKNMLGWVPQHSFVDGLRHTIPWYTAHLERNTRRYLEAGTPVA